MIVVLLFSNILPTCAEGDKYAVTQNQNAFSVDNVNSTYSNYLEKHNNVSMPSKGIKIVSNSILDNQFADYKISVSEDGLYNFGIKYKAADTGISAFNVSMKIDNEYPFDDAKKLVFPRMWQDEETIRTDDNGNQYSPTQVQAEGFYYNITTDSNSDFNSPLMFFLSAGEHTVSVSVLNGKMEVDFLQFGITDQVKDYSSPSNSKLYNGNRIVIEAENATLKSNYFLVSKTDNSTTDITPHNAGNTVLNYIGGGNWNNLGDTITWKTPALEEGYYCLGFSFRQNSQIGGKTYRTLKIDGEVPFSEAENIGFSYDEKWQNSSFSDEDGKPYLFYFSNGVHELSLTVTAGKMASIRKKLSEAVSMVGDLYLDINMITGENVDIYRDYDLFSQISDMEERLNNIRGLLSESADELLELTGSKSGSKYSIIMNLIEVIDQMLKNKYDAHKYKSYFYSNYCSVSSTLQDLKDMPLSLDKIVLYSVNDKEPFEKESVLSNIAFSVTRFIYSFTADYNSEKSEEDKLTIWVNWGRDQAQVLDSLIKRSFSTKTGVKVEVKLTNASVVQAVLSGVGPDCVLQQTRSEPVNLAMRGVLYNLSSFDDCDEVLKRFQNGAEIPYMYKNSLYALPDTQTYFMMFYRKDVFEDLGLSVPKNWDEFKVTAKLLARNNFNVWLPNNTVIDTAQINHGIGSVNIFPSLLLQNKVNIYSKDGKSTNLGSSEASNVFSNWTDYYNKMKFPKTLDFYNRFRTGTTPLGISVYTLYTTLTVAAPEIAGLWGMVPIPGTVKDDGTIDHSSSGGGTGCCILKNTNNPEIAWKFLKWWTSEDTQLTFSNDIESILGPSGRVALSNINAIKDLPWNDNMLDEIMNAWNNVREIPEYPGSYYVSRSVYQAFWNVVEKNKNPKEMLVKYGGEADNEIKRKWRQYSNR